VIYSYNKTNETHYFTNLFWYRPLHISDRFSVHHQESRTVHTAIGICHTGYADCLLARLGRNSKIIQIYAIVHLVGFIIIGLNSNDLPFDIPSAVAAGTNDHTAAGRES
jgi:hypothetical protein